MIPNFAVKNAAFCLYLAALLTPASPLPAQQSPLPAYLPSRQEMMDRYREAARMDSAIKNTIFKASVHPWWQQGGRTFSYMNLLKDSLREYWYVDAVHGRKQKAFDPEKLAAALGSLDNGQKPDPQRMHLDSLWFDKEAAHASFRMGKRLYCCDLHDYSCTFIPALPKDTALYPGLIQPRGRWESFETDSVSPDKKWIAFIKEGNVFIRPVAGGDTIPFTGDGSQQKAYGALAWSPDSKYLVGYHIDPVEDSSVYYVLSSVPHTTRGQLRSQKYKQPGDPFTTYEMYIFHPGSGSTVKVNTGMIDFFEAPFLHWRGDDARYFMFEKVDRGHQRFRIIEVDAETGQTRTLVDEQAKTFIYEGRIFTHYLPATHEILWTSEKDGWRHIYLVDAMAGRIKEQVTKGKWVVREIDSVDEHKREIWFSASGMNPGEDPYHVHYYRVGLDGKNLVTLTPAMANHHLVWSPDKEYYLDTYSEVDLPPVTALHRTKDGEKIMDLEKADISAYLEVVKCLPEPFHAKGRDGMTDIWGIVCRPTHFDPGRRYPVIENIYAGPQDAFVPKSFMGTYREMQSLADLGFIVVQIDGMGTANRSKSFHDVCWKNLADAGFPDRIRWIKALATKYPYVDTTRVGLFGTSAGGQNALGGLLFHPEFYKVAVSACGCHDNRVDKQWWNEQWMGYPLGKEYEEQSNVTNAGKLQGDLLLIVGEADMNVPPESTYRVVDALIRAGKTFDFLAVPGMGHSDGGPYGRIKKRDFFVKHLLGIDPPRRNSNELSSTNNLSP